MSVMARISPLLTALRVAWAALPVAAGPALAGALDDWARAPRTTAAVGSWAAWAIGLVALLVLSPVSLTAIRMLATTATVWVGWAAVGQRSPLAAGAVVATTAFAFVPETATRFVNGMAYPNECRFPLRVPGPLLLGPLLVAWALSVGGPVAAALLLASKQWIAGGIAVAVAGPLSWVLGRAIHGLARRWLVFVPAGVVVHDPLVLADPVLFTKAGVERIGPATADTGALDLTQRSLGLALEIRLREPARLGLARRPRAGDDQVTATAVLVTPTRPGAVLREAASRGLRTT